MPIFPIPEQEESEEIALFSGTPVAPAEAREHELEGQLAVDVINTPEDIIVVAPMAGARPEHIELHLHSDVLTVRGQRQNNAPAPAEYFYKECYWGKFSRTVVLPTEVRSELVRAEYKNGVLTIILPKKQTDNRIPIVLVEE